MALRAAGEKKKSGPGLIVPKQIAIPTEEDADSENVACTVVGLGKTGTGAVVCPGNTGTDVASSIVRQKVNSTYSELVVFNKVNLQKYKAKNRTFPERRLLELCCSPDSLLCGEARFSEGCVSTRVTKKHDILTASGREFSLAAADYPGITL